MQADGFLQIIAISSQRSLQPLGAVSGQQVVGTHAFVLSQLN